MIEAQFIDSDAAFALGFMCGAMFIYIVSVMREMFKGFRK